MATQKTLSVHPCAASDAAENFAVLLRKKTDTCGGLVTVNDLIQNAECFDVRNVLGEVVARYALRVNHHGGGDEVVILAAVGALKGADLVMSILPYIEKQAAGAKSLTVHTKRRGLLHKLAALGFECDGFILRKALA